MSNPNNFSHLLQDLLRSMGPSSVSIPSTTRKIPYEVLKSSEKITINAELPGFTRNNIGVDFRGPKLKISGHKVSLSNSDEKELSSSIKYGLFSEVINLPVNSVEKENVTVKYRGGILTVTITLQQEEKSSFSVTINSDDEEESNKESNNKETNLKVD